METFCNKYFLQPTSFNATIRYLPSCIELRHFYEKINQGIFYLYLRSALIVLTYSVGTQLIFSTSQNTYILQLITLGIKVILTILGSISSTAAMLVLPVESISGHLSRKKS